MRLKYLRNPRYQDCDPLPPPLVEILATPSVINLKSFQCKILLLHFRRVHNDSWIPDRVWPLRITMYPDRVFQRPRCRPDTIPPYRRPRHRRHPRNRFTMYQSARSCRWNWTPPWKVCKGCRARRPPR